MKLAALKQLRKELNDTYFEGKLEEIPIRITRANHYYGDFVYRPSSRGVTLRISGPRHKDDPSLIRDTLLHELVHQYLYQTTGQAGDDHGEEFLREASRVGLVIKE